jgi:hypothetical protein
MGFRWCNRVARVIETSYAVARVSSHATFGRAVLYLLLYLVFALVERKYQVDVELTQLSHSASQRCMFACGSMVHFDHIFVVFALVERKNDKQEKRKYRSAEGSARQLRKF